MWPYPKIVAHRGAGVLAPENTLAALEYAVKHHFYAIECDVMLSSDDVPILMHDEVLGRTIAGIGKIADLSASTLLSLDAGRWLGAQFAGVGVCTYLQALHFCERHGIWMNVEIKPSKGLEVKTGHIVAEVTQDFFAAKIVKRLAENNVRPDRQLPLFSSFSHAALNAARITAPTIPRGLLMDQIVDDWVARLADLEAIALHTNYLSLSERAAHTIKKAGYGLFCYTVNDPVHARKLFDWGIDGLCTDRVDLIGPDFI